MGWIFTADSPLYAQLVNRLQVGMVTGIYPPGSRLPAVRELAQEAGVTPNTVQRAYSQLEQMDLVHTQRTSGRFVTHNDALLTHVRVRLAQEHMNRFWQEMLALGYQRGDILELLRGEYEHPPLSTPPKPPTSHTPTQPPQPPQPPSSPSMPQTPLPVTPPSTEVKPLYTPPPQPPLATDSAQPQQIQDSREEPTNYVDSNLPSSH